MVVYFIQRPSDGAIKIGVSNSIRRRVYQLKIESGEDLKVLGIFAGDRKTEKELHAKFDDLRIVSEWFTPDALLLEYISQKEECLELSSFQIERYIKVVDIGKERYEWLESHPEYSFPVAARAVIDTWMRQVPTSAAVQGTH